MSSPKRRRLDTSTSQSAYDFQDSDLPQRLLSDVNAEVETEIALKEQLSDALQDRIAWALMLQDSLKKASGHASQDTFRSVALNALSVTEQTASHILQKDPAAPPPGDPSRTTSSAPRPPPRKAPYPAFKKPAFLYIRSSALGPSHADTSDHSGAQAHNHLYLLKCPGCARTAFTSLQGLLNHARLTHALEWGTHDECIRACAVVDNDLDVGAGIEVGVGPAGILPGLRTIFQRAVGGSVQLPPRPPPPPLITGGTIEETAGPDFGSGDAGGGASGGGDAIVHVDANANVITPQEEQALPSAGDHLIKTLGFHSESPALAPFLGKETIRREIKVCDEDQDIDIFGDDSSQATKKAHWKMPFTPRNFREHVGETDLQIQDAADVDMKMDVTPDNDSNPPAVAPQIAQNVVSSNSRFHFIARIIITDRSMWIPPAQRPIGESYTHKWMMSVDAPAYTHHITSVLNSVRVGPSDPSLPIPTPPPTTTPPFVVVGFCDRPFLAKVELSFSGTASQNKESDLAEQKVSFEHWVDLDPLENPEAVQFQGQDQVLDVELDKSTVLKPPQLGYVPLGSKTLWNMAVISSPPPPHAAAAADVSGVEIQDETLGLEKEEESMEDVFELSNETRDVLARIVKQFPMTLDSAKRNRIQLSSIPYRLPTTLAYLRTLVMGRRKAIEWARARAVQEAYEQEIQNLQDEHLAPLSVGDVYWWMSETGHFLREKDKKIAKQPANQQVQIKQEVPSEPLKEQKIETQEGKVSSSVNTPTTLAPVLRYCRVCGLEDRYHDSTKVVVKEEMENLEGGGEEEVKKALVKESYAGVTTLVSNQEECHVVPRVLQIAKLPNLDIRSLLEDLRSSTHTRNGTNRRVAGKKVKLDPGAMVATVDPKLMLSIQKVVSDLQLPTFRHLEKSKDTSSELFPLDALGAHRADVENTLAPTALLAHATKHFMRVLVQDGLEVAKRDRIIASGMLPSSSAAAPQKGNRRRKPNTPGTVMLTPTHILSGILTRGRGRSSSSSAGVPVNNALDAVILSSLSKLGIGVDDDSATPSCQGEGGGESEARVKLEE